MRMPGLMIVTHMAIRMTKIILKMATAKTCESTKQRDSQGDLESVKSPFLWPLKEHVLCEYSGRKLKFSQAWQNKSIVPRPALVSKWVQEQLNEILCQQHTLQTGKKQTKQNKTKLLCAENLVLGSWGNTLSSCPWQSLSLMMGSPWS